MRNKCLSLAQKRSGKPIAAKARPKGENVVDLMDALKRSIANNRGAEPAKGKKPREAAAGQKEMLRPINGKRAAKVEARGLDTATKKRRALKKTAAEISGFTRSSCKFACNNDPLRGDFRVQ